MEKDKVEKNRKLSEFLVYMKIFFKCLKIRAIIDKLIKN